MAKGKPGRPKGTPNFQSLRLLRQLDDEHRFDLLKKSLKLFGKKEWAFNHLHDRMKDNVENDRDILTGLSFDEIQMYNNLGAQLQDFLFRLIGHCYPKLKAVELQTDSVEKVQFHVQIGGSGEPKKITENAGKDTDEVIDVPADEVGGTDDGAES